MGNACSCCRWSRVDTKDGKCKKADDKWFEQDSMSLVTARHDTDDIGSDDEADGSIKRKVLLRSPRHTSDSRTYDDESFGRHSKQSHRAKSASMDEGSGRHPARSFEHGEADSRRRSRTTTEHRKKHRHHHSAIDDDQPRRDRRSHRSTSLEVQDSERLMLTSSISRQARFPDGDTESVDSFHDSTRSHRSSSASSSSPKASSRTESPNKTRYGRKHYRADANRKVSK